MSSATSTEPGLRPWQFFLLAGMLGATAVVVAATGQTLPAILVLSFTVVATAFVGLGAYRALLPLVSADAAAAPALMGGRTRAALEREKALALRAIKELEFDFAMGKIAQADHDELSGRLRARAMRLMRQLDAGGGYREAIERELGVRRALAPPGTPAERPAPAAAVAATCAACATLNDADARFCKSCGKPLAEHA